MVKIVHPYYITVNVNTGITALLGLCCVDKYDILYSQTFLVTALKQGQL